MFRVCCSIDFSVRRPCFRLRNQLNNIMYFNLLFPLFFSLLVFHFGLVASGNTPILYNGFNSNDLILDGIAEITPDRLLSLTNNTKMVTSHAFYPDPIPFKHSPGGPLLSFSTTFVFGIIPQSGYPDVIGHGFIFIITPARGLPSSMPKDYLGLFNTDNNGNTTNHVVGVEFDTNNTPQFNDIDGNHVGIDLNSLISNKSESARYFIDTTPLNVSLHSGQEFQAWIEYDASKKQMDVTLAPLHLGKPSTPSLTLSDCDLSPILNDVMYIGFSSSTGSAIFNSHYILGWSFALNKTAPPLDISKLPELPKPQKSNKIPISIGIAVAITLVIVAITFGVSYVIRRKKRFSEELEDWESDYGPHRFKYRDLYVATKGFKDKELLGTGGFGKVYMGTLQKSNTEVAVKKVSHDSKQGMKEFVAEIVSIGRLRHRNVVQLLGYCRRKGELLLVYEYMPKGSLDKYLHQNDSFDFILNWEQRFNIIKGVASGLLYLHEGWEQVVVHRDIKASNVLLNCEMNPRLGDFGLARLHDRGSDPQTTHVMGTLGYLAPEHTRTGKATPSSDVFAYGAFILQVVCGRRPIELLAPEGETMLVDIVFRCWRRGEILRLVDRKMKGEYVEEEAEAMLKLGLLCSNVEAEERPTMRDVVAYLDGVIGMPNLEGMELGPGGVSFVGEWKRGGPGNDSHILYSTHPSMFFTQSTSITESQLLQGR